MKSLHTVLNFEDETISVMGGPPQKMKCNEAGQIVINMLDFYSKHETLVSEISESCEGSLQERCQGLTRRECRVLLAQSEAWGKRTSKCLVAKLFSPPRFSAVASGLGERSLSYDIRI